MLRSRRRRNLVLINKKKIIFVLVDLSVPTDHVLKIKEKENTNKYLDLASELKKLWKTKVTVLPIVVGVLGTVTKSLEKKPRELRIL